MFTLVLNVFIVLTTLVALFLFVLDRSITRSSVIAELESTIATQAKEIAAQRLAEERMIARIEGGQYDDNEQLWTLLTDIDFETIRAYEES